MSRQKVAVLTVRHEDERQAISELLEQLGLAVQHAQTGQQTLLLVEDVDCDLIITDINLPDIHAWALLGSLKEIIDLKRLPVIVLSDDSTVAPLPNVTSVMRPFAITRLRRIIEDVLNGTAPTAHS